MGRFENQRATGNEVAATLVDESSRRPLSPEELQTLSASFTGVGGLVPARFDGGQFFTPPVVISFIIDLLGIKTGDVLEPSCGGGAFLQALPPACRVTGCELNLQAAAVAQLLCPKATILTGDTLLRIEELRGRFDYCVGNPPFIDFPRGRSFDGYTLAAGQRDAVWYFLELGLEALRPGGWLAFVVPDGILANSGDLKQRMEMLNRYWLRACISLPRETFLHAGTGVKTSVLVVQRPTRPFNSGDLDYSIFMAVAEQIGWDSRRRPTGKCDLPEILTAWRAHPAEVTLRPGASTDGQEVTFYNPSCGEPPQTSLRRL